MSVTVKFECSGCFQVHPEMPRLERKFHSISGRGYGFGHWEIDSVESVTPEGWVTFDPYTGCCYCPECWAEIVGPEKHEVTA